jgi:putative endonuclease
MSRRAKGADAERAVADWLAARGVVVLGMNVRVDRFEIDVLVRERDVVAIVEVRARGPGALEAPLDSVSATKQARLRAAAERLWARRFQRDPTVQTLRFDIAGVRWDEDGGTSVEWVRGAF